jgi:hypothetical protein
VPGGRDRGTGDWPYAGGIIRTTLAQTYTSAVLLFSHESLAV